MKLAGLEVGRLQLFLGRKDAGRPAEKRSAWSTSPKKFNILNVKHRGIKVMIMDFGRK